MTAINPKDLEKSFSEMKTETQLLIQIEGGKKDNALSSLVGKVNGQYLIVHTPALAGFYLKLKKKDQIIVKYFHDGMAYGFRSTLLYFMDTPFRLSFLSYPDHLESMSLRSHERVTCFIPAAVTLRDVVYEGVIMDLSLTGCNFHHHYQGNEATEIPDLEKDEAIKVGFALQQMEDLVQFTIDATVRNFRRDGQKIAIGAQFREVPPDTAEKISHYIGRIFTFNK